ncbi:hypothetical protein Tco_1381975, partial [Tanacetum coccineum]
MTITRFGTPEAIEELVNRRVEEALAAHEATRAANALEAENQSQNGSASGNGNGGNGDGKNGNGGNGNGRNGNGRNKNPDEDGRGDMHVARECTYQDFIKCQPLNFKGTEGVVGLISVLTWCNSNKRTIGTEAAFAMSWRELMKLMTKVLQDAVRIANNLMDQKLKGGQNVARAYTVGNNEKKPYNGLSPLCNKCKLHHEGPCTMRCGKCNKVGHLTQDWQGHYRSACPKLKDRNHGNKAGNKNRVGEARGKAYVLGGGDANPDSNVVK